MSFFRNFASLKGELVPYLVRKQFSKPSKDQDTSRAEDDVNATRGKDEPNPGGDERKKQYSRISL